MYGTVIKAFDWKGEQGASKILQFETTQRLGECGRRILRAWRVDLFNTGFLEESQAYLSVLLEMSKFQAMTLIDCLFYCFVVQAAADLNGRIAGVFDHGRKFDGGLYGAAPCNSLALTRASGLDCLTSRTPIHWER